MELLLIRHGQTESNVLGALDTADPGAALTSLGEQQARELAENLAGTGLAVDALFCSPRQRTRQTAAPLVAATGLVPAYREGLAEMSAGDWEMSATEEHRQGYAAVVRAWMGGDHAPVIPGGEPLADILARFDEVVDEATGLGVDRVAMVAHGGIIRLWTAARATRLPDFETLATSLRNTGVVRLERTDATNATDANDATDATRAWRLLEWDQRAVSTS